MVLVTGRVHAKDGAPVGGAIVQGTSVGTQITRTQRTRDDGRFTLTFPDGGSQYVLVIRYLGLSEGRVVVTRASEADRVTADITLQPTAAKLSTVVTHATGARVSVQPEAGGTMRALAARDLDHLPVSSGDFASYAALTPGVVQLGGSDSSIRSFVFAGQRPTLNAVTLDGLTYNGSSVPQEALRTTRVISNTYDVSRGQFSGGLISATTQGGTNNWQGSFNFNGRSPAIAYGPATPLSSGQFRSQVRLGGGVGGPLVRDRLFTFTAVQFSDRSDGLPSLASESSPTLNSIGVNPDSARRLFAILKGLGVPVSVNSVPSRRDASSASVFERVDWLAADNHTVSARIDWRDATRAGRAIADFATPTTGGFSHEDGGTAALSLASHFGAWVTNDARAMVSRVDRLSKPYLDTPVGSVLIGDVVTEVNAALPPGLAFGGTPYFPQMSRADRGEFTDELTLTLPDHRVRIGALLDLDRFQNSPVYNRDGTFAFGSLQDLESGTPYLFTRELVTNNPPTTEVSGAGYVADTWTPSDALEFNGGIRLEASRYGSAPKMNGPVDSIFRLNTSQFPTESHASPRVGFTWSPTKQADGLATTVIHGGAGEFRGPLPNELFGAAQVASGLPGAERSLVCLGAAAPIPQWSLYLNHSSSLPTTCQGGAGVGAPSITAFEHSFEAPRVWRASVGVTKRFLSQYTIAIDGLLASGTHLFGVTDDNLRTTPAFTLPNESRRPVYVPLSAIDPSTGAVDWTQSRKVASYGHTFRWRSDLRSETQQLTFSLHGHTGLGWSYRLLYTWSHSRDESSFGAGPAIDGFSAPSSAGNPNTVGWAPSDYQREHSLLATLTLPFNRTFEFTAIGHLNSGAPFTPLVAGDINGDGAVNDRSFIFDPKTATDTAVANGMRHLLGTAPSWARDCLTRQMNKIASRNSCTGPWAPSLDMQVNARPTLAGLARRLMVSLQFINVLAGFDEWVHGQDHMHGWGQALASPDALLLVPRGFDPNGRRFLYSVNPDFGTAFDPHESLGAPFQVALQLRLDLAPDLGDRLANLLGEGAKRAPSQSGSPSRSDWFSSRFAGRLANPYLETCTAEIRPPLTADQRAWCLGRSTRLQSTLDSLTSVFEDSVGAIGGAINPPALIGLVQRKVIDGRQLIRASVRDLQTHLSPTQWRSLPERVRRLRDAD